jgi:MFS family permease
MLTTLKKDYITNKYYTGMYIHMISNQIINTIITIFTGPFLLSTGVSLSRIFFFYFVLEIIFVIGLFITPLLVNGLGYVATIMISYFLGIVFFLSIAWSAHFPLFLIIAAFAQGFQKSFYYPVADTLQAAFIDTINRGKQLSVQSVLTSLAAALTAYITGLLLNIHHYLILFCIIFLFIILAISPLFAVFKQGVKTNISKVKEILAFLISKEFKKRFIQTSGIATSNTILGTVLSLYVFFYLRNFKLFGIVVVIAMLFQITSSLYLGRLIDTNGRNQGMQKTTFLAALGNLSLILLSQSALVVSLVLVYVQTTFSLYITAYDVNYNDKAKESNQPFLYSLSVLIVMGGSSVLLFGLLTILSRFMPFKPLFILIFLFSLVGMFINLICFEA